MITAVLISLLLQPAARPSIPPGTTRAFQESAYLVQKKLSEGKWAEAQKALGNLPRVQIRIDWDDAAVPSERRVEFRAARDRAIRKWSDKLDGLKVVFAKPGDLKFSFTSQLPSNADSTGPAGAVFLPGDNGSVEGILALYRSETKVSIEAREVQNEVLYGIANYLGLERTKYVRAATNRMEISYPDLHDVQTREIATVERIQTMIGQLERAIKQKVKLPLARPQLTLDTRELDAGKVNQGDIVPFTMLATNSGTGPLEIRVVADCGCFRIDYPSVVMPGESAVIKADADTLEFPGDLHKTLYIYSNDPDATLRIIPVRLRSEPAFRFLHSGGPTLLADENGAFTTVFLTLNPARKLKLNKVSVVGAEVELKQSEWTGMMADPEMNEPEMSRTGIRFDLKIPANLPPGRTTLSLEGTTDDPLFPLLQYSFYVQRGILISPERLYLGEIKAAPMRAWIIASRPGKAFKIVKIESDNAAIRARAESLKGNDQYKIVITFNGKSEAGPLEANLKVITDDASQREIPVQVTANIR